jgi:hypothetical protein
MFPYSQEENWCNQQQSWEEAATVAATVVMVAT